MEQPADKMQCVNETCQASNPLNQQLCYQCGLPLVKRYLLAIGTSALTFNQGELIGERYLCKQPKIFLDTKPGRSPEVPETLPRFIQPYLKLFLLNLHVPRVYGKLLENSEIWLLEYPSVPIEANGEPKYPALLPSITELWSPSISPLQQLNWLWQLVRLWEPLKNQGVISTLFNEDFLKINGSFLQLQQLQPDELMIYKLKDLASLWQKWLPKTSPSIKGFLEKVCQQLEKEEITESEELIVLLDRALKECQSFYNWSYSLYSQTDTGPSRLHNEDSCYPDNQTLITNQNEDPLIAIVCDGIGGQEGGEVASKLAIDSLIEEVTPSGTQKDDLNIYQVLKKAIYKANDLICQRNDEEDRSQRQRMGTTLVMTVTQKTEIYLANVGDSRVYWITPQSCHQVTVDDDIASREVSLGHDLYRNAIEYPNAGSLTQALGTGSSKNLYPAVQRQISDQDCLILLTSDGLSDYDLIEQYWHIIFAPLLEGKKELAEVGESLIELANSKNGHDNTTIILIHYRVQAKNTPNNFTVSLPEDKLSKTTLPSLKVNQENNLSTSLPSEKNTLNKQMLAGIVTLFIIGVLGYLGYNYLQSNNPDPTPSPSESISP